MTKLQEQIHKLRDLGYSYNKIVKELGCAKSSVCYTLGEKQKEKTYSRTKQRRNNHPYIQKIDRFLVKYKIPPLTNKSKTKLLVVLYTKIQTFIGKQSMKMAEFNVNDVLNKFGENPTCYLTGQPIDIFKPQTYHFDHIIPVSRGGTCTLDNLGICTKMANQSKFTMTPDEFVNHCKLVLEHFGYTITKSN